ncbi:MAG: ABC transporter permease [Candidatus Bipolaricaulota bacterium]|nr:ABC transporter permease [Candidatus Bipolaricaulota bacterium]MDW8126799.1 ABC transporter permease [Candidatus Bipolaricaulota bacterium]
MIVADVGYVAWRELLKFFRAKTRLLVTVIQPLLWLGLMGNMMEGLVKNPFVERLLGTGSYLAFMTPGVLLMTVLFGGVFAGMSIVWDRRIGYLEKLLAAPISRAAIPLGKMMASAVQGGFQGLLILLIATGLGVRFATGFPGAIFALVVAMTFSLILSGFSLALAARIKSQETLMAVVNFFTMPLMFTSNALFPREAMPGWLATLAQMNPVTHAVTPIRQILLFGWDWGAIWVSLLVIGGLAILMMFVAAQSFLRTTVE